VRDEKKRQNESSFGKNKRPLMRLFVVTVTYSIPMNFLAFLKMGN
jgi:hypothetical protein